MLATFNPVDVSGLIAAINTANANNEADTIDLGGSTFTLTLVDHIDQGGNGLPRILSDSGNALTIQNGTVERDAVAPEFRIFSVSASGNLTVDNVTVSGGSAIAAGGGFRNSGTLTVINSTVTGNTADSSGGGIENRRTLNVINSTVTGNSAGFAGGGIFNSHFGTTNITDSTISANSATEGGGIRNSTGDFTGGNVTVTRSTISGNSAINRGGGILNRDAQGGTPAPATLSVADSKIFDNTAASGGGIENRMIATVTGSDISNNTAHAGGGGISNSHAGTLTITKSTLSGNTATAADARGGAILTSVGSVSVSNSTISGNSATVGGAIASDAVAAIVTTTVNLSHTTVTENSAADYGGGIADLLNSTLNSDHTIIAANTAVNGAPDVFGSLDGDYNLVGNGTDATVTGTNNQVGTSSVPIDPLLGPLKDNGGPTFTHAVLPGSPAIDAGDPSSTLATDQRGFQRPEDGDINGSVIIDIGSFELPEDNDTDGVGDQTEAMAPNGGDGNNDGTPDNEQDNVASLLDSDDGSYITVESSGGSKLVDVIATSNPSPSDAPQIEFPIGHLAFNVDGVAVGGSTTVTLYPENPESFNTYYKYGPEPGNPTPHWYEFLYQGPGTTGAEFAGNTIILHFIDGQRGDDDLTENGVIVDPGAPSFIVPSENPAEIQGLVWEDFNNNGEVDFGEKAISGVAVTLSGTDVQGNPVSAVASTDPDGVYMFTDLPAGTYSITETQPAGFDDGMDVVGTVNGSLVGDNSVDDVISGITLGGPRPVGENYNFGERPQVGGSVSVGQTATIGFWQNNNGQALIESLNGGPESTQLSAWLASTFVNMYGNDGMGAANANDLSGMTNAEVADFYSDLFRRNKKGAVQLGLGGPVKFDAQVMAVALATYVTNQTLAGQTAESYGFLVTENGVGTSTFNVGGAGEAFDVDDNSDLAVLDLLFATDNHTFNGVLYDDNGDGDADDDWEAVLRRLANDLYSAINEAGDA